MQSVDIAVENKISTREKSFGDQFIEHNLITGHKETTNNRLAFPFHFIQVDPSRIHLYMVGLM